MTEEFSHRTRHEFLGAIASNPLDLLIVGGGITGAFAAWDAASRGLRVALVERGDFGSGTSSRSSRLAHGGQLLCVGQHQQLYAGHAAAQRHMTTIIARSYLAMSRFQAISGSWKAETTRGATSK